MSGTANPKAPVPTGGTIGILGGGQLGRMLALAAARLGLKTHIFCDEEDAPASQVSFATTRAAYDDEEALRVFASQCDAITFEFENVPAKAIAFLEKLKATAPHSNALAVTQDRLAEKNLARSLGLATPDFFEVNTEADAKAAFAKLGKPGILKTRRMGYDGKGQAKVASADECATAFTSFNGAACILESLIAFDFEASVIAARSRDGSFAAYDPPENRHENHILKYSTVPARLDPRQVKDAVTIAKRIAEALNYVGVLAVELFVAKDGTLLVNEIAPRVHNSGHWTIEACAISQFEQHIRAVAGWPLGDTARHSDAVMENLIGEEAADYLKLAQSPGGLHLYGKSEIRPGRKMGHITRLSPLTKA